MFDVLAYLFEQFQDPDAFDNHKLLTHRLAAAGFDDAEIQDALDWLVSLQQISQGAFAAVDQASSLRIYSDAEQKRLSTEIRGLLQFLEDHGALSAAQREMVIHRLLALTDDEITVPSAKLVALMVLWIQKAELPILLGEELLDAIQGQPTMQ